MTCYQGIETSGLTVKVSAYHGASFWRNLVLWFG